MVTDKFRSVNNNLETYFANFQKVLQDKQPLLQKFLRNLNKSHTYHKNHPVWSFLSVALPTSLYCKNSPVSKKIQSQPVHHTCLPNLLYGRWEHPKNSSIKNTNEAKLKCRLAPANLPTYFWLAPASGNRASHSLVPACLSIPV